MEGTLDFAQIDPQSAAKYVEFKRALVKGEPEKDVAEARASSEYKDAYDAIGEALGKVPKRSGHQGLHQPRGDEE